MARRFRSTLIVLCLCAVVSTGALAAPKVTVTQYPDMIVVYVHDLDLLRAAHPALTAEVRLDGIDTVYRADLAADYQTPAILIRKGAAAPCKRITVKITAGAEALLDAQIAAEPVVAANARVPLTPDKAFIAEGTHIEQRPEVFQPAVARLPELPLAEAERRVDLDAISYLAKSEINFPLISAKNNCAISRQTAHPTDDTKRSVYVPLKSQLYDAKTGNASRVAHYLAEVPLKPEWLQGTEDAVIRLDAADITLHTTDKRWPPGNPKGAWITGQGAGGLGQLVGGLSGDKDGNIYYSGSPPSTVVRFCVAKAEFETPPVNLMAEMNKHLPAKEALPAGLKAAGVRWDSYSYVGVADGRMYVMPVRYSHYGALYCNGIFSFPIQHWYDAAKFRAGMHFIAGSWPGSHCALYDAWPTKGHAARKIAPAIIRRSKLYLRSYSGSKGGPWRIDLNPDGSSKSVTKVEPGEVSKAQRMPQTPPSLRAGAFVRWWDYGALTTSRAQVSQALTGTRDNTLKGNLTIYYDAIGAMRKDPKKHELLLANLSGPSLAPCYMAVAIPDKPGHILGIGEYGYYLADLDIAGAKDGVVTKSYLHLDLGDVAAASELPVRVGLGPYGRVWTRDGDKRYLVMPGYTGVARMLYSVGGKVLERHDSMLLSLATKSLDSAAPGGYKRARYPVLGMDGRVYLTGTHTADRGGTAYSTGLASFNPAEPKEVLRLSHMSRGGHTYMLRARTLFEPDGTAVQQFVLNGSQNHKGYLAKMEGKDVPENPDCKVYLYDVREGAPPRDLFGFSTPVVDGKSGVSGQVFSRDRRYLLTLQHGAILSFDMAAMRYVDGHKLDANAWEFARPDYCFQRAPDDRIFLALQKKDAATATFHEVIVSPAGVVSLRPHLTLAAPKASALVQARGVLAFVPDPSGDGSCDLALGLSPRGSGTRMWIIRDFLPVRTK